VILGREKYIPDSSHFEVEIAIAKLERYKAPGSDQIPAELIQADRLERILTMVYVVQSYWACFGLYPSSCMWKPSRSSEAGLITTTHWQNGRS
jgi:hypothetical protein